MIFCIQEITSVLIALTFSLIGSGLANSANIEVPIQFTGAKLKTPHRITVIDILKPSGTTTSTTATFSLSSVLLNQLFLLLVWEFLVIPFSRVARTTETINSTQKSSTKGPFVLYVFSIGCPIGEVIIQCHCVYKHTRHLIINRTDGHIIHSIYL